MGISRTQLVNKVRRRLGEPLVKVELCDEQIVDHIDYARQKYIKWAIGNATQEVYFTLLLQAGVRYYDLPAGVMEVVGYIDAPISSGGINTLFSMDNYLFSKGFFGNTFFGGYDLVSYHLVLDFMSTLARYRTTPYNWKYHKRTNQLEINPVPVAGKEPKYVTLPDPETGVPTEYAVDSPGWILLRTYMIEGSTLPNYTPDWRDILKEKKTLIEQRTVTTTDISTKSILLNHTPFIDGVDDDFNIKEDANLTVGGVSMTKGIDWDFHEINPRLIIWEGYDLEENIAAGDKVAITYPVVFESQYYPDEWTDVTATTTEVEDYTITQGLYETGYIRLRKNVYENNISISVGGIDQVKGVDYDIKGKNVLVFKGYGLQNTLSVDDTITVTYVSVTSMMPIGGSTAKQHAVRKQYTTRIENVTVTADQITAKAIVLSTPCSVFDGMKFTVGGFTKIYGVDFVISNDGTSVVWTGLGLDGIIAAGDDAVITYSSATPIVTEMEEELYDSDWIVDYVTALSKISLGIIRRKFGNFTSLGNQGISLDGDALISEGNTEKENLERTLREEEAFEGYGIEIGMM